MKLALYRIDRAGARTLVGWVDSWQEACPLIEADREALDLAAARYVVLPDPDEEHEHG